MALTRKYLKALDIDETKIEQIIDAHTDVTDALKADRDKYKEEAEKIDGIQKELDDVKKERDTLQQQIDADDSYKTKYENEHKAYEEYKKGVEANKTKAKKVDAYKELLKKAGVSDKRIGAIVKVTTIDDIELDDNGNVKDADKVVEDIKAEWSEFIVTERQEGAGTENPPKNNHGDKKMTKEEIDKIEDTSERQKAMLENLDLYGI